MERSPELQALSADDNSDVASGNVKRSQRLGMGLLLIGGAVAIYFLVLAPQRQPAKDMLDAADEQFNATTFRPPSYVRDIEKTPPVPDNIVKLPEQPEKPVEPKSDTTEFDVPAPPVFLEQQQKTTDTEQKIEPEEFPGRYKSKLIVVDNSKRNAPQANATDTATNGETVSGTDANSKFLATASTTADRSAEAKQLTRLDALVPEGSLIPGILETAVTSDLPGQMRAIVSKDVWSFDGRRIIIPTGTRLIGEYQSNLMTGQTRIFVVWTRLIRSDGASIRLNSIGADSVGRAGMTGNIDKHFRERFGNAILLSIVGGSASYLTGYGSGASMMGGSQSDSDRAAEITRNTIAQTFSNMANQALSDGLKIPPTISIAQGERIFVYVRQDLDFSALYPDPVEEALEEIKRERGYR